MHMTVIENHTTQAFVPSHIELDTSPYLLIPN